MPQPSGLADAREVVGAVASAVGLLAGDGLATGDAIARASTPTRTFIEDATRATALPTSDLKGMLALVLGSLPDSVKVYPTENYYYFYFYHNSIALRRQYQARRLRSR